MILMAPRRWPSWPAPHRTAYAECLVLDTALSLDEGVELSGFGSRQTLFRQLRRHCGDGGRALRQIAAQPLTSRQVN